MAFDLGIPIYQAFLVFCLLVAIVLFFVGLIVGHWSGHRQAKKKYDLERNVIMKELKKTKRELQLFRRLN